MKVLTAIYLDKRRVKSNNSYPLKLRVSQQQEIRYYSIGIDITESDWKKVNSRSSNPELKKVRAKTTQIIYEVDSIIRDMADFTFAKFETAYLRKEKKNLKLEEAFNDCIMKLKKDGGASTSECYGTIALSDSIDKVSDVYDEILIGDYEDNKKYKGQIKRLIMALFTKELKKEFPEIATVLNELKNKTE